MSLYRFDTIVSKQEAAELKEMIFRRVRERADMLASDTNDKYTNDAKFDVMDLAHASFENSKNPFVRISSPNFEQTSEQKQASTDTDVNEAVCEEITEEKNIEKAEIGFPVNNECYAKEIIKRKSNITTKEFTDKAIELNMMDAQKEFANKSTFIGALNFLNSQASISLINRNNKSFTAIA